MDVLARPAEGCDVTLTDFADITSVPVTAVEWAGDGVLRVTFASDLTAAEQQRVRLRITASDAAEEQMRLALAAFLTSSSPTIDQTNATLKRLIRVVLSLSE